MYSTRLPSKESPFNSTAEAEQCSKEVRQASNMSDDKFTKIEPTRHFAAFLYPFCKDKDRYLVINKIMLLLFVFDDHTDNQWGDVARCTDKFDEVWGQLEEGLTKILNPDFLLVTNGWKPYTLMLYQQLDEVSNTFNDTQKKRLVKLWMEYIESIRIETRMVENKNHFNNIDDYFKIRVKTIGLKPLIQLQEYAEDIFITEEIWSNRDFQQLINLASHCVFLCNDLHSFGSEKVSFQGQLDKIQGCIKELATLNNISIEEARQETIWFLREYEEQFIKKKNHLLNAFEHDNSLVAWIVNRVEHMVGGHYQSCVRLLKNRYQAI